MAYVAAFGSMSVEAPTDVGAVPGSEIGESSDDPQAAANRANVAAKTTTRGVERFIRQIVATEGKESSGAPKSSVADQVPPVPAAHRVGSP